MEDLLNRTASLYPEAKSVVTYPDGKLWGDVGRPYPTNDWWTPACLEGGTHTIHPFPYQLQLQPDRVVLCYPDYIISEKFVSTAFVEQMSVGCREGLLHHRLVKFDDLSATFVYDSERLSRMEVPVVQGSPYVSFLFKDATPSIHSVFAIVENFKGIYTGSVFRVPLNNGQTWMISASSNISFEFNVNPCVIKAAAKFTGILRVALVPEDQEASLLLDRCRHVVPIGGRTRFRIDDQTLSFDYDFETVKMIPEADDALLLMMALPHHVKMNISLVLSKERIWYRTIKGPMNGVLGTSWTMTLEIRDVWWDSIEKIDPEKAEVIRGSLYAECRMELHNTDPYASGKRLAAIGRLAIIADELEETVVAGHIRDRMEALLEPWLTGTNRNAIVYDPHWGGLISTEGSRDRMADFGSGMYNDHHFQYGYFVYAAAVVGRRRTSWLQSACPSIFDLIRDYANPLPDDPYFPRLRHFDPYVCHSWASGLFVFQDGKNQESTSEAINAYHAVALLGQTLGHRHLTDFGLALMHLEIVSTQSYWHIPNPESSIYPHPFSLNGTVGIVWGGKVDYAVWFGSNPEYIHCIQMIPFLPISELFFSAEWIHTVLNKIGDRKDDPSCESGWRGFIWMAISVLDKEAAWTGFSQLTGAPDLGNSVANALYWIATRPQAATSSSTSHRSLKW